MSVKKRLDTLATYAAPAVLLAVWIWWFVDMVGPYWAAAIAVPPCVVGIVIGIRTRS